MMSLSWNESDCSVHVLQSDCSHWAFFKNDAEEGESER